MGVNTAYRLPLSLCSRFRSSAVESKRSPRNRVWSSMTLKKDEDSPPFEADAHYALPIRVSGGRTVGFMHAKSVYVPIRVDTRAV